jgi:methyltransferase (TIGR00027 family)
MDELQLAPLEVEWSDEMPHLTPMSPAFLTTPSIFDDTELSGGDFRVGTLPRIETAKVNNRDDVEPGVARTAQWAAAMRALEYERADSLIIDPLASLFAGDSAIEQLRLELEGMLKAQPEAHSHIAVRCRAFDDLLQEAFEELQPAEAIQVVNIGAGMCTRAWRLQELDGSCIMWYEVDLPSTSSLKGQMMTRKGVMDASVDAFYTIGMDFSDPRASLAHGLEQCGFDCSAPTVFILEGFLMYLDYERIWKLASEIAELTEGPTRLLLSCINDGFLEELTNPNTEQCLPGKESLLGLFFSSWEDGTREAFEEAGWIEDFIMSREGYARKYLHVPMLSSGFPDPARSTEYVITMHKRSENSLWSLLDDAFSC